MKKILLLGLVITFVLAMGGVAYGYGYNPYDTGTLYTVNPHGGYTASSNFCKTCHAVHEAGDPVGTSWKLLRATSSDDACDFCHIGAGAHTNKVAYGEVANPTTEAPGHTIGQVVSTIPDSGGSGSGVWTLKVEGSGGTLVCNSCHSVHGAGALVSKILRKRPSNEVTVDATNVESFCRGCHGDNDASTSKSHPYGTAGAIAWTAAQDCNDCHNATGEPHASNSSKEKMLTPRDGTSASVSQLDNVCRRCHLNSTSSAGVGVTF